MEPFIIEIKIRKFNNFKFLSIENTSTDSVKSFESSVSKKTTGLVTGQKIDENWCLIPFQFI